MTTKKELLITYIARGSGENFLDRETSTHPITQEVADYLIAPKNENEVLEVNLPYPSNKILSIRLQEQGGAEEKIPLMTFYVLGGVNRARFIPLKGMPDGLLDSFRERYPDLSLSIGTLCESYALRLGSPDPRRPKTQDDYWPVIAKDVFLREIGGHLVVVHPLKSPQPVLLSHCRAE